MPKVLKRRGQNFNTVSCIQLCIVCILGCSLHLLLRFLFSVFQYYQCPFYPHSRLKNERTKHTQSKLYSFQRIYLYKLCKNICAIYIEIKQMLEGLIDPDNYNIHAYRDYDKQCNASIIVYFLHSFVIVNHNAFKLQYLT